MFFSLITTNSSDPFDVRMLPYSLGSAMISALTGILVSRTGKYRPIIWTGFAIMTIGYGLMTLLTDKSHM